MTPSTIRLPPCQICPPKFLQLLILPPQGRMSRLNTASTSQLPMMVFWVEMKYALIVVFIIAEKIDTCYTYTQLAIFCVDESQLKQLSTVCLVLCTPFFMYSYHCHCICGDMEEGVFLLISLLSLVDSSRQKAPGATGAHKFPQGAAGRGGTSHLQPPHHSSHGGNRKSKSGSRVILDLDPPHGGGQW